MIEVTPTEFGAVLADVDTVSSVSYSTRAGLTLTSAHGRTLHVSPKDMHRFANRTSQTLPRVGDEFSPLARHVHHDGSMVPMTSGGLVSGSACKPIGGSSPGSTATCRRSRHGMLNC